MNVAETPVVRHVHRRIDQIAKFCFSNQARDELEQGAVHPVRAMVLRAVLATPGLPDFLYQQRIVRPYEQSGYHVVGAGAHATALRDGSTMVRKVYEHTAHLSEDEQQAIVAKLEARQSLTIQHLGHYSIPQSFAIDHHPLHNKHSVVIATQQFIPTREKLNFYDATALARPELMEFKQDCYNMAATSEPRALPDLAGNNNVLLHADTHEPALIDPIALLRDDPTDQRAYTKVSRILERAEP